MVVKFVRSLSVWSFPVQSTEKASFVPKRQDPKALGNWGRMSLAQKPSAAMGGKMHEKGERKGFASGTSAQFGKALAYGCVQIFCRCTFSGQEVCGMSLVPSSNLAHCRKKPAERMPERMGYCPSGDPWPQKNLPMGKIFLALGKRSVFSVLHLSRPLGKVFQNLSEGLAPCGKVATFFCS